MYIITPHKPSLVATYIPVILTFLNINSSIVNTILLNKQLNTHNIIPKVLLLALD